MNRTANIEYFPEALINGKPHKDVFKCHKDTKIPFSNMDMMISRELQENDIVAFTVLFGWTSNENPLYELMMNGKNLILNTEK